MLTILTDVRGVCQSVCLSVTWLKSAAARAVYATYRVRGFIRCSLRQIPLASCYYDHYECGRLSWLGQLYGAL